MKLKYLLSLLLLKSTLLSATEYSCPILATGSYVSIIDTLNGWYIHATEKNSDLTIMNFKINKINYWNKQSIEHLQNHDGSYSNLITCSSNESNFDAHVMLTVPESYCSFKDNNSFNCY